MAGIAWLFFKMVHSYLSKPVPLQENTNFLETQFPILIIHITWISMYTNRLQCQLRHRFLTTSHPEATSQTFDHSAHIPFCALYSYSCSKTQWAIVEWVDLLGFSSSMQGHWSKPLTWRLSAQNLLGAKVGSSWAEYLLFEAERKMSTLLVGSHKY